MYFCISYRLSQDQIKKLLKTPKSFGLSGLCQYLLYRKLGLRKRLKRKTMQAHIPLAIRARVPPISCSPGTPHWAPETE